MLFFFWSGRMYMMIIGGSLEVKLPTIWTDEKQRWAESEKRRVEERRSEKRKGHKKEDADARKGRKVAKHSVFPMICGSGGSKSRLAKAAGAEPSGQMRDEKVHAVVGRSTFASEKATAPHVRGTFGSWDVEKVHAIVARSTCQSQNVQSTPAPDQFWKLRCRKSAGRCGAKHISKSKCTKHQGFGLVSRGRRKGLCTLSKVSEREDSVAFPQTMAGVGHLKRICKDAYRVAGAVHRSTKDMFIRDVRRSGCWFPEKGCILEHRSAALTASYQWVLRFFHSTCLKHCACQEKVMPGHTKCCTCHAKSS